MIRMLGTNVLIKPEDAPDKVGALYVAPTAKSDTRTGRVVSAGLRAKVQPGELVRFPADGDGFKAVRVIYGGVEHVVVLNRYLISVEDGT